MVFVDDGLVFLEQLGIGSLLLGHPILLTQDTLRFLTDEVTNHLTTTLRGAKLSHLRTLMGLMCSVCCNVIFVDVIECREHLFLSGLIHPLQLRSKGHESFDYG